MIQEPEFLIPSEFDGKRIQEEISAYLSVPSSSLPMLKKLAFDLGKNRVIEQQKKNQIMEEFVRENSIRPACHTPMELQEKVYGKKFPLEPYELAILGKEFYGARHLYDATDSPAFRLIRPLFFSDPHFFSISSSFIRVFDEGMEVCDHAAPELFSIRSKKKELIKTIQSRLRDMIHDRDYARILQEDYFIELNGRYVLLLRADFKGKIKGLVHGTSNTGQTLYFEPEEMVETNNGYQLLCEEERREIYRILQELNFLVLEQSPLFTRMFRELARFDVARALCLFSQSYRGCYPDFSRDGSLRIHGYFHPLVPGCVKNEITLTSEERILILSGPNAGGKTVTLKTIGLCFWLAGMGLRVPALSCMLPEIRKIGYLMGDYQSLSDSLSSFSAHLARWKKVLDFADESTILFADEIMNATDPREGAALAMELVKYLAEKNIRLFVSTHYEELKTLALESPAYVNASMVFDLKTLTPKYILSVGTPGNSYGIELFSRFELPSSVAQAAKKRLGSTHFRLKELVEKEKKGLVQVRKIKEQNQKLKEKLDQLLSCGNEILASFELERKKILGKAYQNVLRDLEGFRKRWQKALQRMEKASVAEPDEKVRQRDEKFQAALQEKIAGFKRKEENVKIPAGVALGDSVRVSGYETPGVITAIKESKKEAIVQMGLLSVVAPLEELEKIAPLLPQKKKNSGYFLHREPETCEVDLRGCDRDETLWKLDHFLDSQVLADSEISIICGKGTLKTLALEMIRRHPVFRSRQVDEKSPGCLVIRSSSVKQGLQL